MKEPTIVVWVGRGMKSAKMVRKLILLPLLLARINLLVIKRTTKTDTDDGSLGY